MTNFDSFFSNFLNLIESFPFIGRRAASAPAEGEREATGERSAGTDEASTFFSCEPVSLKANERNAHTRFRILSSASCKTSVRNIESLSQDLILFRKFFQFGPEVHRHRTGIHGFELLSFDEEFSRLNYAVNSNSSVNSNYLRHWISSLNDFEKRASIFAAVLESLALWTSLLDDIVKPE